MVEHARLKLSLSWSLGMKPELKCVVDNTVKTWGRMDCFTVRMGLLSSRAVVRIELKNIGLKAV